MSCDWKSVINSSGSEMSALSISEVAAVVVTYHPDERFPERIVRTAQQVNKVIVIDNHSNRESLNMLRVAATSVDALLVENSDNLGVATAFNQGIRLAISQGYDWILMLDQDSLLEPEMVKELITAYKNFSQRDRVAIIAPVPIDERSGYVDLRSECEGRESIEVPMAQTSGSLISAVAFEAVGPLREEFFIDYVDFEHCFRLRDQGLLVIVSCKARLLHNLGASVRRRFLWKESMSITHYNYIRRYYITRNRLLMMREYALSYPIWAVHELLIFGKDLIKIFLFEKDRKAKYLSILLGVSDALLNRTGKFVRHTE